MIPDRLRIARLLLPAALVVALPACDYLGLQSSADQNAAREAEGKAIGGGCRHAGRAIEDCYAFNPTASKAAVFAGWKAMNDYMAENKLEVVKPQIEPKLPGPRRKDAASDPAKADRHGKADAADRTGPVEGADRAADHAEAADPVGRSVARARLSSR